MDCKNRKGLKIERKKNLLLGTIFVLSFNRIDFEVLNKMSSNQTFMSMINLMKLS